MDHRFFKHYFILLFIVALTKSNKFQVYDSIVSHIYTLHSVFTAHRFLSITYLTLFTPSTTPFSLHSGNHQSTVKWIIYLNIKCETINILEENKIFNVFGWGKSLDITQKAQPIKEKKITKLDLIKIKIFCSVKDSEKDERQATGGKYFQSGQRIH